jgi:O-antigen/teichoic acid export membrane protein
MAIFSQTPGELEVRSVLGNDFLCNLNFDVTISDYEFEAGIILQEFPSKTIFPISVIEESANKISLQLFKNEGHSSEIKILSINIIFIQITNINLSILQGTKNIKELSLANILGNFFGLLVTLPLIIIYKQKAIVYSILFGNLLIMLTTSFYVSKKVGNFKFITKLRYLWTESKEILRIGIVLSTSGILVSLNTYFTQLFITKFGNFTELGFYTASYSLVVSYVGLILTAMSTEYYPRLCSIINDNDKLKFAVSTQSEIITLLITPIIIIFFLCSGIIINILYTKEFISIKPLINLLIFGMIFRSISWCISFVFSAKGNTKTFLLIEI